jgi:hypothetical protein
MNQDSQWHEEIYQGLRACLQLAFPLSCPKCGREYFTLEDFIASTKPLSGGSGLREYADQKGEALVGLFRACACRAILVTLCENRRDTSVAGQVRRSRFEALLELFVNRGLEKETARRELRKLLLGQESPLLSGKYNLTPERLRDWFHPGGAP